MGVGGVAENLDVVIGCLLGCFVRVLHGLLCRVALSGCFAGLCEALWWVGI